MLNGTFFVATLAIGIYIVFVAHGHADPRIVGAFFVGALIFGVLMTMPIGGADMNQVIVAYHVTATGTISLNEELDDFKHVPFERCRVWPGGTGLALRDWLRTKGYEPEMIQLPTGLRPPDKPGTG